MGKVGIPNKAYVPPEGKAGECSETEDVPRLRQAGDVGDAVQKLVRRCLSVRDAVSGAHGEYLELDGLAKAVHAE